MEGIDGTNNTKAIRDSEEPGGKPKFSNYEVVQNTRVKSRCIHKFKDLPIDSRLEIVRIIKDEEGCHQNVKKVQDLSETNNEMALYFFKNKAIFIEMLDYVTTGLAFENLSYMERPISFQDKDPRMMHAIRNLFFSMSMADRESLSRLLGMGAGEEHNSALDLFSNCIFDRKSRSKKGGKPVTLNLIRALCKANKKVGLVEVIDIAKCEPHKLITTDNKLLTNILSKPLVELEAIDGLQVSEKISAAVNRGLNYRGKRFLILLFHMVCQPEDRGILDWMYSEHGSKVNDNEKQRKSAQSIIDEMRKQNKPFVVLYEALQCCGDFDDEMQVELERWADKNKNLFLQQS